MLFSEFKELRSRFFCTFAANILFYKQKIYSCQEKHPQQQNWVPAR